MSGDLSQQMETIRTRFEAERVEVRDSSQLEQLRTRYLGRKQGAVTEAFRGLGSAPKDQRPALGQQLNALKAAIEQGLEEAARLLEKGRAAGPAIDLTPVSYTHLTLPTTPYV